ISGASPHYSEEVRLRLPDSSERWLFFAAAPKPPIWLNSQHYFGICFDVTDRKLEEKNRLLSQEVRHRVKNMLAVVLAIAHQTAFGDVPSASVEKLVLRIAGLGASLDLLTNGTELSLSALIQAQLASFVDSFTNQVTFRGPALALHAAAAQALGMAFHELATNSMKYGALSKSGGRISIQWEIRDHGHGKQFHTTWSEQGGPEIKAPIRQGFGYTVMVSAVEASLAGKVQLRYPSSGLVWELTAPLDEIMVRPS
ncbi:MAG: sensor histidine kinase, partial [Rhodomicrobium sp.]